MKRDTQNMSFDYINAEFVRRGQLVKLRERERVMKILSDIYK